MPKDQALIPSQDDAKIPFQVVSEAIIEAQAPAALRTLRQMGAMDLVDILGLAPHTTAGV